jgi:FtsZ-interacting cell division protein ZipA
MSNLGKILLYVAFAGAIAALVVGGLLIKKRWDDAAVLQATQKEKADTEIKLKKSQDETTQANTARGEAEKAEADAKAHADDLDSQLTSAKKDTADAKAALDTATANTKTIQDQLDKMKADLGDKTVQQYKDAEAKAESDLAAAQSEQKILQDQLQGSQEKVADLMKALNTQKSGGPMPGISGKVTFVDRTWNFVVLDVGVAAGVVPNGELIVYRGRDFLGKIRVTKVEDNDSVAEILPDIKGNIQVGDSVLN